MHGIQTGVAFEHAQGSTDGSPKHLRMGVNSALVSISALCHLLVEKGLITWEEYSEELRIETNKELDRYEARTGVTLR